MAIAFQEENPSQNTLQHITDWCSYLGIEYLTFYAPNIIKNLSFTSKTNYVHVKIISSDYGMAQIIKLAKDASSDDIPIGRNELMQKLNYGFPNTELVLSVGIGSGMQYSGIPLSSICLSELYYMGRENFITVIDFYYCLRTFAQSEQRVGK